MRHDRQALGRGCHPSGAARRRCLLAFGMAAMSGLAASGAQATTVIGEAYVSGYGNGVQVDQANLDPFRALGRLDRVSIVGTVTQTVTAHCFGCDITMSYSTSADAHFQFGSLPLLTRSLTANVQYVPDTNDPDNGTVTRTINVPISFSFTRADHDLSSFILTPEQIDDGQEDYIHLTVEPFKLDSYTVANGLTRLNGTVRYDYDLTADELGAAGVAPEPTAWMMLVAGFAIVGGAMRRHRALASSAHDGRDVALS